MANSKQSERKGDQQSDHPLTERSTRPGGSTVQVGSVTFGANEFVLIAGPCSVENETQLARVAHMVASAGASMLRGGAFKPRTTPYSFQGLGKVGLKLLHAQGQALKLPVVTEVMSVEAIGLVSRYADMLQVGARNMQNYALLKALGACGKPIMLKRGLSATLSEWLCAAEYILHAGNDQVVLCERGIRTFETSTRNTLDLNSVALAKRMTHLPVIVDPSHGTGRRELVTPMTAAAVAAGADGVVVEVHPEPAKALSDGAQSLDQNALDELVQALTAAVPAQGRSLASIAPTISGDEWMQASRRRIDHLDAALVRLLAERVKTGLALGEAKLARGLPLQNPGRESRKLENMVAPENAGLDRQALQRIFRQIMDETLLAEQKAAA